MCCVWVSGLNQIDIDVSAAKLPLFTSFSHSPLQLCQDYACCHHSPNLPPLHLSYKCITSGEERIWKNTIVLCRNQQCKNTFFPSFSTPFTLQCKKFDGVTRATSSSLSIYPSLLITMCRLTSVPQNKQLWYISNSCSSPVIINIWLLNRGKMVKCPSLLWLIWAFSFWQYLITKPGENATQKWQKGWRGLQKRRTATAWNLAVNRLHVKAARVKGD